MKPEKFHRRVVPATREKAASRKYRRGFALILVLGFIVLLTVIILAFFSNSILQRRLADSSASQTKADLFARGALDDIVGDLKQEIVDGSTSSSIVTGSVTNTVYTPSSAATMVPYRAGSDPSWTNLVKRSANGINFYSLAAGYAQNGPSRAATCSTTQASLNGRYYSAARWNDALLLPPTSASNFTPNTTTAFVVPDWILVAQDGSNPTAWNTNMRATPNSTTSVLGRYAYCVYDEGGLLDMNVAGYPSTPADSQAPYKNAEAYADLTQLTDASNNPYLTQAQINQIVNWRNAASLQQTPPAGLTAYAAYVTSNLTGFLTTANTALTTTGQVGQSDRLFTSRQQLIAFFNNFLGGGLSQSQLLQLESALQYLTTFSRDLNAPSWSPATPTGSTIDYAGQKDTTTSANRNVLGVRAAAGFIRADGTTAQVGEPFLKHRFPLSRLAGLTYQGIDTTNKTTLLNGTLSVATAATIQRDFGLVWVMGTHSGLQTDPLNADHWNYCGPGTSLQSSIATLDAVKQANREPNFFELLKAAILSGSLGRDAGPTGVFYTNSEEGPASGGGPPPLPSISKGPDQNLDLQVIQIGANIIDQFDSDSYPTEIHFTDSTNSNNPETACYGTENLPYLHRVFAKTAYSSTTQNNTGWYMAEVWNPHQSWGFVKATTPTQFKFCGRGLSGMWDWPSNNPPPPGYRFGNSVILANSGSINFTVDPITYPNLCREPTLLSNDQINNPPCIVPNGTMTVVSGSNGTNDYFGDGSTVGINSGVVYAGDTGGWGGIAPQNCDLVLEYQASNGNYQVYSVMRNFSGRQQNDPNSGDYYYQHVDPRTDRLGTTVAYWNYSNGHGRPGVSIRFDNSQGLNPGFDYFPARSAGFNYTINTPSSILNNFFMGTLSDNSPTSVPTASNPWYTDPDGVVRTGAGAYATGAYATDTNIPYNGRPLVPGNPASRPIILNRPFRNVGELGYVFRDVPWREIDFFTTNSGDAALLDLFCVNESETLTNSALVAGTVNINTSQAPVLQAIIAGAMKDANPGAINYTSDTSTVSNADAKTVANAIVSWTGSASPKGPFQNRSDLVTRASSVLMDGAASISNQQIKIRRESALRALSDVGTARTWTFMIDVIAQVGRYPANANGLSQFLVEGEKRYWLHVSIDRYTGQVIDSSLEPIYE